MTTIIRIRANDVELDPQVGFIGFADAENERYFWMQPGENETGMSPVKDEIWLERDDQQWGGSGGDWRITLSRNSLVVDTQNLPWMACDLIEIDHCLNDAKFESLKQLLQRVMVGCIGDLSIED